MIFVDTNYFLRFLIGEPEEQYLQAKKLFEKAAAGQVKIGTSVITFFEIYWVVSSFYGYDKSRIVSLLTDILKMEFIDIENKKILYDALETYKSTSFDMEDAYNLAYARLNASEDFLTFDTKLNKKANKYVLAK